MWDKDKIMKAVDSFVQETGRFPNVGDFYEREELPSINAIRREWGTTAKFQNEMYETYSRKIIPGTIEKDINPQNIKEFVDINGRLPYISEICNKELSSEMADKYVDAITEIYINKSLSIHIANPDEKERIVGLIDKFVESNNRLPKAVEFRIENGLVGYQHAIKHIGKISDFYKMKYPDIYAKGVQEISKRRETNRRANGYGVSMTEEDIKNAIDSFVKEHGRLPERHEFGAENGMPGLSTSYTIIGALGTYYAKTYPELVLKSKEPIQNSDTEQIENLEETVDEEMSMGM